MWKFMTSPYAIRARLWKQFAKKAWRQRNALERQNARQRRLLVWILNQLVQEQSAKQELDDWDTRERLNSKGGKA